MSRALEGLKVLDFSWVLAGPGLTRCLGDFGATVIKVETHAHPDLLRSTPPFRDNIFSLDHSTFFANYGISKYSITVNLNHPEGVKIIKRLLADTDIVVEQFTPGTMAKWGLGYENLVKIKPDIILVSLSLQGHTGPYAHHMGFGINIESLTLANLIGWEDRSPQLSYGYFGDILVPRLALCAIMAALDYRESTGKGQHLDVNQLEATTYYLTPLLLDYFANGRETIKMGNRSTSATPHGVYPCCGDDQWCALSVSNDEQWRNLCRAMGNPPWASEPKFATILGRKANEDELDKLISSWTIKFSARELMILLQEEGVPSGAALNGEELHYDSQLQHRGCGQQMKHPVIGNHFYDTWPFQLSETPAEARMPAPCLGEHTEYICTQMLGMSEEEFVRLFADGVFD